MSPFPGFVKAGNSRRYFPSIKAIIIVFGYILEQRQDILVSVAPASLSPRAQLHRFRRWLVFVDSEMATVLRWSSSFCWREPGVLAFCGVGKITEDRSQDPISS